MSDQLSRAAYVVVTYASHALLEDNLAPLVASAPPRDVVVVDCFSSVAERAAVAATCGRHGWELVALEVNAGFGGGMNAGASRALELGADALVLLNPDAALDAASAGLLVDTALREPCLAAPAMRGSDGRTQRTLRRVDLVSGRAAAGSDTARSLPWLSGAALALSSSTWERLGGFADDYFMYWEDVDLSVRAQREGVPLVVVEDAVLVHDPGGTQPSDSAGRPTRPVKSPLYVRYNCRGRLVFASRIVPRGSRWRWVAGAPAYAADVLLRSGRREVLGNPRLALAAARGTAEGLRYLAATARRPRTRG